VYEMSLVKEKGRPKSSKGERHIPPESRPAYSEFHDEATMCIFRLKSLKEGQARSLLIQAVRHHTAQVKLMFKFRLFVSFLMNFGDRLLCF